jgi:AcrR family transcriptional regulator
MSAPKPRGPRPGTAVGEKGQARAREILRAARRILVEDGYPALTTRKVAEAAGIRQSNVQYYFPAKVDLVRALFEDSAREALTGLQHRMGGRSRSPKALIIGSVDQFLAAHDLAEHQTFLRELWAMASHDPAVADVMRAFYQHWVDLVTSNVLAVNPQLDPRKAQRRALLIVALVDGLSLFHGASALDHPALVGIEREVREVVMLLVDGADE